MKRGLERAAIPVLAFAIPAAVMLWVYASLGMAPWGDKTVLITDMSSQYVEFFCALKHGGLFFSWSKALGTSYIGVFSYYVSSPLSLLTLLVPNEAMPVGLMFLVVLKLGLAGLAFAVFAQRRFPDCGYAALLGAVCYALMSYNAAYSICIMWLDGVIWLPLVLLALERILAGRGAGPFIAALTVCFISTWYISYMIGIFCALYLCARLTALNPDGRALKKVLLRFFGGAACALGLTAWLWLPTFLAMFAGKFSGGNAGYSGLLVCSPTELLGQLRAGAPASVFNDALPFLYCGVVALVGTAAYFFQREHPLLERLANGVVLGILTVSLLFVPLDMMWHLFQRPNWFPFRWSFLFSFFLIYLAVQVMPPMEREKPWPHRGIAAALLLLTVFELGWNTKSIVNQLEEQFVSDSYQAYQDYYAANAQLTAAAQADAGDRFYRVGATEDRGHNSPLTFGYPGITHYSSLYNYDVNQLTRELGFAQSWMWCAYYGSTPVTDAVLDVEYVISWDGPPGYEPIAQAGGLTLWKNPDVLPLAFCPEAVDRTLMGGTAFARQNDLLARVSGVGGPAFTPVDAVVESRAGETVFTLVGTGKPLYTDLSASGLQEVLVNGERVLWLGYSEAASIHCLGTPAAGETWTVTVHHQFGWSGQLWELDQDALHAAVEQVDAAEITSVDQSGRVRLTAEGGEGRTLVTTIPAERGWTIWVDGKKTEGTTWLDTFLAVNLPAGEHEVELCYTAPGLVPGAVLGIMSAAGLALVNTKGYIVGLKYKKKRG